MADTGRRGTGFLAELKRRHVVRVAAIYLAVGFAVLEAADIILPRLGIPDWVVTVVIVVLLLGFPMALVLAWAYEVTPEGVRVTSAEGAAAAPATRWFSPATVVLVLAFLAIGVASGWILKPAARPAATPEGAGARSIAVLPFVDRSPEGDQRYLAEGLAEELLNVLGQIPDLRVAARTSAFAFGGENRDMREIGLALDVATVLEGSVRREGDELRITAQLIDVESGYHLWSESYDRQVESVFAIQEEMAAAIARALRVPLGIVAQERLARGRTDDVEAYEMYLEGRLLLNDRSLSPAIARFRESIERDSSFAPAWGGLAEALALQPYFVYATWGEALPAARAAAERALALDSTLASAHTALANVLRDSREREAAEREYLKAIELDPQSAEALDQYGQFLVMVGRTEEAIDRLSQARDLDPLSALHHGMIGWAYIHMRDYERAIRALERSLALDPTFILPLNRLVHVYLLKGDYAAAERYAARIADGGFALRMVRAVAHDSLRDEALRELLELEEDPAFGRRDLDDTSAEYGRLDYLPFLAPPEVTLDVFERWSREGVGSTWDVWDPAFDPLRDHPRFQAAVARFGFEGTGR